MPQRALSGAVYVGMVVFCLWFSEYSMISLFLFLLFLLHYEFNTLINRKKYKLPAIVTSVISISLLLATFIYEKTNGSTELFYIPLLLFVLLPLLYILIDKEHDLRTLGVFLLSVIYFAAPLSLAVLISFRHTEEPVVTTSYQAFPVLSLFVFLWVYDTFAYLAGTIFGKTPLIERISPKKTWEGVIGGVVMTLLLSLACSLIFNIFPISHAVAISLIVVIFGTLGDLFESWIKRSVAIKDFGNIMPGHGGALDRLDSFLFSVPAMWVFYSLFG